MRDLCDAKTTLYETFANSSLWESMLSNSRQLHDLAHIRHSLDIVKGLLKDWNWKFRVEEAKLRRGFLVGADQNTSRLERLRL